MIKVAIIGMGGMGKVHYAAYKEADNCKVVAVADVRKEYAVKSTDGDSVNIYSRLDEILTNESPDIIDICTPSYMHKEMSIKALEAGINVICEKPVAHNAEDAKLIMEAAKKSGKLFMTAHVVRFMNAYIYLRNIIESGELGKPVRIDMKRLSSLPQWSWENWLTDISKSGGAPIDLGIHDIDYVQSIFGSNPDLIKATRKIKNNNDLFISEMHYGDTVITTECAFFNADIEFYASYRAVFQDGYVECTNGKIIKNGEAVELLSKDNEQQAVGLNISASDGYASELRYFVSCVENNTAPQIVTPESTVNTMILVEKLLSAADMH